MNLFRILLTSTTGRHLEEKPFETFDLASEYAQEEMKANGCIYYHVEDLGEAVKLKIEITDTFGGEANYSWVKRHELWVTVGATSRECVTKAKAISGWTGTICRTEAYGDSWKLIPTGALQVMFVSFEE